MFRCVFVYCHFPLFSPSLQRLSLHCRGRSFVRVINRQLVPELIRLATWVHHHLIKTKVILWFYVKLQILYLTLQKTITFSIFTINFIFGLSIFWQVSKWNCKWVEYFGWGKRATYITFILNSWYFGFMSNCKRIVCVCAKEDISTCPNYIPYDLNLSHCFI